MSPSPSVPSPSPGAVETLINRWFGLSLDEMSLLVAIAAIVVAVILAAVGPDRLGLGGFWRNQWLFWGFGERAYADWFVQEYRKYHNVYADRVELLDLAETYVPLSCQRQTVAVGKRMLVSDESDAGQVATSVVSDRTSPHVVILGEPGSGKSTLLRAYGVGAATSQRGRRRRTIDSSLLYELRPLVNGREVPFLVPLRDLASELDRYNGRIVDYLVDRVLVACVGMQPKRAVSLLRQLLQEKRCLLLLDGLDEVPTERYAAIRSAIYNFVEDKSEAMPTGLARVVLTSRTQNFGDVHEHWLPAFATRVYTLMPFRDSDIFRYLDKRRQYFDAPQTPEIFINAIRQSGTLDRHRVPLVLAMSVGLYLARQGALVPQSVFQLYRDVVVELLGRHDFRSSPKHQANRFTVEDKLTFLRAYALHAVKVSGGFGDMHRKDMEEFAGKLSFNEMQNGQEAALVQEIIQRSGLLTKTIGEQTFIFAHRSIHEFLAALQLQEDTESGRLFLLRCTNDRLWRQVIEFFSASRSPHLSKFMSELADRNSLVAARCLAAAQVPDWLAKQILQRAQKRYEQGSDEALEALLSAARSPRRSVRQLAVMAVQAALTEHGRVYTSTGTRDLEGTLRVVEAMAQANAAQIAALVPQLMAGLPNDPRLVGPLWACLTAPGIESMPACLIIVERLLTLVMKPDGLAELERQLPYTAEFITLGLRTAAYPFMDGLPLDSNLVTLLAWAEHLKVYPARKNRYFEAKVTHHLNRVELDERRSITVQLYWPASVVSALFFYIVAVGFFVTTVFGNGLPTPFGGLTFLVMPMPGLLAFLILEWADRLAKLTDLPANLRRALDVPPPNRKVGNFPVRIAEKLDFSDRGAVTAIAIVVPPAIATLPFASVALTSLHGAAVSTAVIMLAWWVPLLRACVSGQQFYLYRRNPYSDIYEDPLSAHWVRPIPFAAAPGTRSLA